MTISHIKQAIIPDQNTPRELVDQVALMLRVIETEGETAVRRMAAQFDRWEGAIKLSDEDRARAIARVPAEVRQDIRYAHDNIRRFAEAQSASVTDCEIELAPGLVAGQRRIPVSAAGCYVPGGRYAHVASALMTITTAKVAGVPHITATSSAKPGTGIPDAIVLTMDLAGADAILALGGVQAVAAMAHGHFGLPAADILVGPGNQYVAEAKRQLFDPIGIDMVAGPTDSMVIADGTATPKTVAWDLVGQAEHGYNSPVWLVTTDPARAQSVLALVPGMARSSCATRSMRWPKRQTVMRPSICMCRPRGWNGGSSVCVYGSLFRGAETTVAFGDKCAGPNHVLPTSGAARYTGSLSVHTFLKTVAWQRATAEGARRVAEAAARISRLEGMEDHARTADIRLRG